MPAANTLCICEWRLCTFSSSRHTFTNSLTPVLLTAHTTRQKQKFSAHQTKPQQHSQSLGKLPETPQCQ